MSHIRWVVDGGMTAFNLVVLSYFFLGNGIYTILMLLSLRATWAHMWRTTYQGLDALRRSPLTPPVTVVIPAWNEQGVIVNAVRSALRVDYPRLHVIVVDDGSTDMTLDRLVQGFDLVEMDAAYHPIIPTAPVRTNYINPALPNLLVVSKVRGGKPDALNAGINLCRSPYFCSLDADCVVERDALLRLMDPILNSTVPTVVSGGIVRILNGCETKGGRVAQSGPAQDLAGTVSGGRVLAQFPLRPGGVAFAGGHADRVRGLRGLPSRHRHRSRGVQSRHGNRRHGPDCASPSVGGR